MQSPHEKIYERHVPEPKKIETVDAWPYSACDRNKQVECSPSFAFSCIGI